MAVFLDSADRDDIREAMTWGFIAGITTNPALMALAGEVSVDALKPLCAMVPGRVFYQLTTHDRHAMLLESQSAFSMSPSQIVLKVPCSLVGLQVVTRLSLEMPCAVTAIFSPAQAYLAKEAGARYIIPYFNRSTRLCGDGAALVREIRTVVGADDSSDVQILAASIKTPAEAISALKAGADHLTLPLSVIREMANHPLSDEIVQEFDRYCQ